MTAISRFSQKIMIYCEHVSHIVGFSKSIIRRQSFSKKSKKFIIFLDNIKNGVLSRTTESLAEGRAENKIKMDAEISEKFFESYLESKSMILNVTLKCVMGKMLILKSTNRKARFCVM